VKKRYEWKELSLDGLLKDVKTGYGYGHYGTLSGGDTEEEAIERLSDARKNGYVSSGDFVLLTIYTVPWERA